ncbi:patatin-like phospholipase family protein [Shewanella livingstonensis]|uniref:Patatin-like phospholipase family protein n=1 Tax=Shewanella livingstonensis TaxID=150120 RepID=A0A3G8LUI1_9GAMM|nr:patatin-like phospholipase family protein [Shewanella livingstonensis]AZG73229.1 patatin-like phospholipase family protein [Shewanella livingstonensis]
MLEIYAGEMALRKIHQDGFSPAIFSAFLGASGGPKWFTLLGLDKYIFGEFFNGRQQPLNVIGSSAGAFRAACFAQHDPVAAIERLAKNYSETVYSDDKKPQAEEITTKAFELLEVLFGDTGADEIINNPVFKAHFIVAKCNGLVASENKFKQTLGLTHSFIRNAISRPLLNRQYERYIFQHKHSDLVIVDPDNIPTTAVAFSPQNIKDALLASGSIPVVMQGIKDITDCPPGMYRDGGIIDYHFDFKIQNEGLILYPHFSSTLKAGWFDKNLSRKVRLEHYDKTVLLCPSAEFIDSLPYHKIPDRTDFIEMKPAQRIQYWQQVFVESEKLAQHFKHFYQTQNISSIKSIKQLIT